MNRHCTDPHGSAPNRESLMGHERFAAAQALVVWHDAIAGLITMCITIVHRDPVIVKLGRAVGSARKCRVALLP